MSHQVQLSPLHLTALTAVLDPAGHAANRRPAIADFRTPPARQDLRQTLPTLGDPTCTGIFHTSAKDRQDQSARSGHDPAICPLADPI